MKLYFCVAKSLERGYSTAAPQVGHEHRNENIFDSRPGPLKLHSKGHGILVPQSRRPQDS